METIKCLNFNLGRVLVTAAAKELLEDAQVSAHTYIQRHSTGDWGDMDLENLAANDHAVENGGSIRSAYFIPNLNKIWIVTEADRTMTTLLLPEDQ